MLNTDAFRQLLLHLTAAGDDGDCEDAHQADEILAAIIVDPESAARMMLAMASFAMHTFVFEATTPNPERAIDVLTTGGDPIDHFRAFLEAMLEATRNGEKLSPRAIRLSAQIAYNRDDSAIVLWVLGNYLGFAIRAGGVVEDTIDEFIASSIRQNFLIPRQLNTPDFT